MSDTIAVVGPNALVAIPKPANAIASDTAALATFNFSGRVSPDFIVLNTVFATGTNCTAFASLGLFCSKV
jgi:hypothetical protein